jgi:hypothetical protein
MHSRASVRGIWFAGLIALLSVSFPLAASADDAGEAAAAAQQPAPTDYRPIRRLGGATRFTRPVNTVGELQKMFSQPRIQTDVRAVLEMDNLGANSAEVNRILGGGMVMETTIAPGTRLEWMALRRAGKPATSRRVQWAGDKPLEGYQFVIDNLTETLTFFVPKICGNVSLMAREPSREAARRAEEARKAEAAKAAAAAAAADAAKKAAADKAAAAAAADAAAKKAAADKAAADAAAAEAARKAAADKAAADAAAAEAARLAAEQAALKIRPFFAGYFGKQQRQYDEDDPAGIGLTMPDNTVTAFGDQLFGLKGGIAVRMSPNWTFNPSLGFAFNLDEGDRTSVFSDVEFTRLFVRGGYVGTGLTLWDFNHGDSFTLGWLGTAGIPIWKSDVKKHQLDLSVEWRQFFDRMSDPDVNYQFWGGIRYLFK